MRILIAEDDFSSRKILQKILQPLGECDFAVNGEEALAAFTAASDEGTPYDLIFLDIKMPNLTGMEVLERIRAVEAAAGLGGLSGVKIVMATGSGDSRSVLGSFRSGCEAYLVKPIEREHVFATLKKIGVETPSDG